MEREDEFRDARAARHMAPCRRDRQRGEVCHLAAPSPVFDHAFFLGTHDEKSHDKRQSLPFLHSRARGRAPPRAEDGAQALPAWQAERPLRGMQPLPAWQGEIRLRGLRRLPAWQAETQLRGLQRVPAWQGEAPLRGLQRVPAW